MVGSWLVGGRAVTGWCLVVMVVDCGLSWAGEGGRESQSESGRGKEKKSLYCIRIVLLSGPICFNQEQDHEWDRMRPDSAGQDKIGRTGRDPRDWMGSTHGSVLDHGGNHDLSMLLEIVFCLHVSRGM